MSPSGVSIRRRLRSALQEFREEVLKQMTSELWPGLVDLLTLHHRDFGSLLAVRMFLDSKYPRFAVDALRALLGYFRSIGTAIVSRLLFPKFTPIQSASAETTFPFSPSESYAGRYEL